MEDRQQNPSPWLCLEDTELLEDMELYRWGNVVLEGSQQSEEDMARKQFHTVVGFLIFHLELVPLCRWNSWHEACREGDPAQ